jgi:DNA-binding CsgD family transcriptional regulator
MWFMKDEGPLTGSKVSINPSYEWSEDAKGLNVSHRELEVFALLVDGHDNKEIAEILGLQYQSVKNHIFNLYKKLEAKNMAQAMKLLLFGNFIKIEVRSVGLTLDREELVRDVKGALEASSSLLTERERRELKKFLIDHRIYGKLYAERLKELEKEENRLESEGGSTRADGTNK